MCETLYGLFSVGHSGSIDEHRGEIVTAPPPSPDVAADEAEFVAALRRLKAWSGLSYRQLERRAADAGRVLPYSTASTALGRKTLPREELLVAFVLACGLDDEEAASWVAVRKRIAVGQPVTATEPRAARRPRWRPAFGFAAVALSLALAGSATLPMNVGEEVEAVHTTVGR
ncbi:helix-turn-helix domain-containing protein [Actinomadura coerulea]|uniref:helix-turn-helix domain-containing protein n=1 Tax=Actinomadura coerulea TaxID=46159 RepID=UPI00342FBAB7